MFLIHLQHLDFLVLLELMLLGSLATLQLRRQVAMVLLEFLVSSFEGVDSSSAVVSHFSQLF
jgi:hypothetical protein